MSRCPKCRSKLEFLFMENIFRAKSNNLKCNSCNTMIKRDKKSRIINSIISIIPFILLIFWQNYVISFITSFTQNNKISECILIFIIAVWGGSIYNIKFPWDEFEEV